MTLDDFQHLIENIYYEKDAARGPDATFMWFTEEVGELAAALRKGDKKELEDEFADCLAWLSTLASISNVNLNHAARKYKNGCPSCRKTPCQCGPTKP